MQSGVCASNFNINAHYGPIYNRNCTVGVNAMDDDYNQLLNRSIDFDATATNFTNCNNSAEIAANSAAFSDITYSTVCAYTADCPIGRYFDRSLMECRPCNAYHTNCIMCIKNQCTRCSVGLYPSGLTCQSCSTQTNCTVCLTATTCAFCDNTTFVHHLSSTCVPCTLVANCILCTDNSTCIECINQMGYNATYDC